MRTEDGVQAELERRLLISASVPAFLAALVVHVVGTRLLVMRAGRGGYGEPEPRAAAAPVGARRPAGVR